jgi:hypothetical protein
MIYAESRTLVVKLRKIAGWQEMARVAKAA